MTGSSVGLFAGIGGIELGLSRSGFEPELACEIWDPARSVLAHRFPGVPVHDDVTTLKSIPKVDVLSAGFPCTDISQAGRTAGIFGEQSSLVGEVFRLLRGKNAPDWVLIENVRNIVTLARGQGVRHIVDELDDLGYRWAYRVVDSRFAGVPQRRQRIFILASKVGDPRTVLHVDDAGERTDARDDAYGFYWTEGLRGLGWAQDAVPTLKGGSTIGIPSPPAIWMPGAINGRRIVKPTIGDAERMQGFARGWTKAVIGPRAEGNRWKLVGNAVTVGVAEWLGKRLVKPGTPIADYRKLGRHDRWPIAAYGDRSGRWAASGLSLFPVHRKYQHLYDLTNQDLLQPLTLRGATGFFSRLERGGLNVSEEFRLDMKRHIEFMSEQ